MNAPSTQRTLEKFMEGEVPKGPRAVDTDVDFLVVGSGTGLVAALQANARGLRTLVIEKSEQVGGNTARSGGAVWIPNNAVLIHEGVDDTPERAALYVRTITGDNQPQAVQRAFLRRGPRVVDFIQRHTPVRFQWETNYPDYHSDEPGGSFAGRAIEPRALDLNGVLGGERRRYRDGVLQLPFPAPVMAPDYRWIVQTPKEPLRAVPRGAIRFGLGIGGMLVGRHYVCGGQALAAGLFSAVCAAGIPVWTRARLVGLEERGGRVVGAVVEQDGRRVRVGVRAGVLLAAGGFEHNMEWRHRYQSPLLPDHLSLGVRTNTGDAIRLARDIGADTHLMDQAWWFPSGPAVKPGADAVFMLADHSLPGSFVVDRHGRRFLNESEDYMAFGQDVVARERAGDPVGDIWMVFDQEYRNSYALRASLLPGLPIPPLWYRRGIAAKGDTPGELARAIGVPVDAFTATLARFNELARGGRDVDFHRGETAYDRYYGDFHVMPNPNLRALHGTRLYAVRIILSDIGTVGGLRTDEHARVLDKQGSPIEGLYAAGNTAGNVFGTSYPGPGGTIAPGLVFGSIAAEHAAARRAGASQAAHEGAAPTTKSEE